jgi:hypothetical protein
MSAATSVVAALGSAPANAGPTNVPLTGTFTYQDRIEPTQNLNCPISGMTVGTGTLSHLGRSAVVSTACITLNHGNYFILSSTITVTAANGDTLTGSYSGSFVPTGNGTIHELHNGTLVINGGTGRFKNATGGGSIQSVEDLTTGQGTVSVIGKISY